MKNPYKISWQNEMESMKAFGWKEGYEVRKSEEKEPSFDWRPYIGTATTADNQTKYTVIYWMNFIKYQIKGELGVGEVANPDS